ncbi:MAG: GNAT family N-acetyltransferase [Pseudomonadota bacterium]
MKLPTRVRLLVPGDAATYLALREEASLDPGYGVVGQVHRALTREMLAQTLATAASGQVFGAFSGLDMPGMVGLGGNHQSRATLFGLYVRRQSRGQSIGRLLVTEVINRARAEGFNSLRLDVRRDNAPAISLYESAGFMLLDQDQQTQQMGLWLR